MEAGDSAIRQSGNNSAHNANPYDSRPRDTFERSYREGSAMATATLLTPGPSYHHPHSSAFSNYPLHPNPGMPGIMSTGEPRRTSDDADNHRQSLPSIQEVIKGAKPNGFTPAVPTTMSGPPNLPSPFPSSAPRPFADLLQEKRHSPGPLHNPSLAGFPDPGRPSLSGRPPAPPLNAFPAPHQSPPVKTEGPEAERRFADGQRLNGSYPQPPPAHVAYPPPSQLPPGQMPLPVYPISPRHPGPLQHSPYDPQQPPMHPEDGDFVRNRDGKYEQAVSRHFQAWSYAEYLAKIASSARTVYNFADEYSRLATEEHGSHPIPGRLPTEREVSDMINTVDYAKSMLESVRGLVQQSVMNERAREGGRSKGPYDDEDVPMYGDGPRSTYDMAGVKKRRGRAAPPGRCHSCNRIDTPEWRRGPDGARTLCNACGLHYAKLERKRQTENQKMIRPKPADERN